MRRVSLLIGVAVIVLTAGAAEAQQPAAQQPCPAPRKVNVGVAVAPPNVVHTAPYVAKALGFFAKHCVDANIIQFDGGAAGTAVTAVGQGTAISNLPDSAIAQGLKARQVWGLAPRSPHAYVVPGDIKTAADLKGRRLSAAGGVGGLNWLLGREVLRSAGLKVEDAQFISQGTAGRLPGFVAGQIEGVALHPEDVYLVQKQKPGAHVLVMIADLMPKYAFNHYGAADAMIAKDRDLVRDTIAAMIEANRAIYRDKDKVTPIIVEATQKPKDAVEYAIDVLTKNCVLSVNEGFLRDRIEWTHQNNIDNGDIPPEKKLSFDQIVDFKLASDAVEAAGGRTSINGCKD
ncbi:MAG: ABC transporter substrate-binding protein [Xanthobacteraceae bacterium]|jgi:ABC-type nitrate/sulfonate/bicarbonate transport system substrate-binding protein